MAPRGSCAVLSCKNTSYNSDNIQFFRFPNDPVRFRHWGRILNRCDIISNVRGNYFICEIHFDPRNITINVENKKVLKLDALPTLNLFPVDEQDYNLRKVRRARIGHNITCTSLETITEIGETGLTEGPIENNEESTYALGMKQTRNWKEHQNFFKTLCDYYLPAHLAENVKHQALATAKFRASKNVSHKEEYLLQLYNDYPHHYKELRDALGLTDETDVAYFSKDKETALKVLKAKINCLELNEKICSLLVRRVPIRPHLFYNSKQDKLSGFHEVNDQQSTQIAKYAVIVMVRGIYKDWHLFVDIALLSERNHPSIKSWFQTILTHLFDMDLSVKVCISNLDLATLVLSSTPPTLPSTSDSFLDTNVTPFFYHSSKKIFFMYNPDYLLFKIRDVFMKSELYFRGIISWNHVLRFYELDSKKTFKLAPELTESHVMTAPEKQSKNMIKQLFSEKVAAAISVYTDFGLINKSAKATIKFISIMSKLIDCLNTTPKINEITKQKTASENPFKYLFKILCVFLKLKVLEDGKKVTHDVIIKSIITLKSVLLFNEETNLTKNNVYLPLKFLNMNILNKFIFRLRKKSGGKQFTSLSLIRSFRKKFFYQTMKPNECVLCAGAIKKCFRKKCQGRSKKEKSKGKEIFTWSDYKKLVLPRKHQFMYVCGYVFKHVYDEYSYLLHFMRFDESDEENFSIYLEFREACALELPMVPPDYVIVFFQKCEAELQNFFRNNLINDGNTRNLMHRINTLLDPICLKIPFRNCLPTNFVKKLESSLRDLYIKIRLYYIIDMNNKDFRNQPKQDATYRLKFFI